MGIGRWVAKAQLQINCKIMDGAISYGIKTEGSLEWETFTHT